MEIVIKPNNNQFFSLMELFKYKELFFFLAWRDIKVRYKQTLIGIFWAVLQPFLTMIVFTFFFNNVLKVSSGNVPYAVFSFTGLIFWNYFSTALNDVSNSLVANQSIITKVFFPRIIIPVSTTIVPLVDFLFSFLILLILLLFFHVIPDPVGLLFVVPSITLSMISALGLGGILSILNVRYRDIRYALPFFIQLLLFITPVIYSIQSVPKNLQLFLYINPMTGVIESMRSTLLHQSTFNMVGFIISFVSSCILLLLGMFLFGKYEQEIADII